MLLISLFNCMCKHIIIENCVNHGQMKYSVSQSPFSSHTKEPSLRIYADLWITLLSCYRLLDLTDYFFPKAVS